MWYLISDVGYAFVWTVLGKTKGVYNGVSSTYDQAFRDCRNFIKRNQGRLF